MAMHTAVHPFCGRPCQADHSHLYPHTLPVLVAAQGNALDMVTAMMLHSPT